MRFLIVGAGFTGSVVARELAENGFDVTIIDKRDHIGGNCYTERDSETGIMEHKYGPHIFHTDDKHVWDYISSFDEMMPFVNRVKTKFNSQVYSLPINLHTINQFYNKSLSPDEAKEFIDSIADKTIDTPLNFKEQAFKFIGKDLYEAFFKGYSEKQWGTDPENLPASILKRLPVRFNYDDNYFSHNYQGIPKNGYTYVISNILGHERIKVLLGVDFNKNFLSEYDHVIWTGKIDEWFDYSHGKLAYRTLTFEKHYYEGDFQGNAVINYGDLDIPYTRISEHKHFSPWEKFDKSIYFKEYSSDCKDDDIPYYPVRLLNDKKVLKDYFCLLQNENNVTMAGRLGSYRYMDMDVTIKEALELSNKLIEDIKSGAKIKAFYHSEEL